MIISQLHHRLKVNKRTQNILSILEPSELKATTEPTSPREDCSSCLLPIRTPKPKRIIIKQGFETKPQEEPSGNDAQGVQHLEPLISSNGPQAGSQSVNTSRQVRSMSVPKWKLRQKQHMLERMRKNREHVEMSVIEQNIRKQSETATSLNPDKPQGFQGGQKLSPLKRLEPPRPTTQLLDLKLNNINQLKAKEKEDGCSDCQVKLAKERKTLIADYRDSLKKSTLGDRAETQHDIKVNRRMRFMYELKRTLVQDPLNSILIAGGDNWPAQKKVIRQRKERYRKLKREETKYSSNKSSLHIKVNPAEINAAEPSEDEWLDRRQVSFGLNQQTHQIDHVGFFKKPSEKIDEDHEMSSSKHSRTNRSNKFQSLDEEILGDQVKGAEAPPRKPHAPYYHTSCMDVLHDIKSDLVHQDTPESLNLSNKMGIELSPNIAARGLSQFNLPLQSKVDDETPTVSTPLSKSPKVSKKNKNLFSATDGPNLNHRMGSSRSSSDSLEKPVKKGVKIDIQQRGSSRRSGSTFIAQTKKRERSKSVRHPGGLFSLIPLNQAQRLNNLKFKYNNIYESIDMNEAPFIKPQFNSNTKTTGPPVPLPSKPPKKEGSEYEDSDDSDSQTTSEEESAANNRDLIRDMSLSVILETDDSLVSSQISQQSRKSLKSQLIDLHNKSQVEEQHSREKSVSDISQRSYVGPKALVNYNLNNEGTSNLSRSRIEFQVPVIRRLSKLGTQEHVDMSQLSKPRLPVFNKTDTQVGDVNDGGKSSFENSPKKDPNGDSLFSQLNILSTKNIYHNNNSSNEQKEGRNSLLAISYVESQQAQHEKANSPGEINRMDTAKFDDLSKQEKQQQQQEEKVSLEQGPKPKGSNRKLPTSKMSKQAKDSSDQVELGDQVGSHNKIRRFQTSKEKVLGKQIGAHLILTKQMVSKGESSQSGAPFSNAQTRRRKDTNSKDKIQHTGKNSTKKKLVSRANLTKLSHESQSESKCAQSKKVQLRGGRVETSIGGSIVTSIQKRTMKDTSQSKHDSSGNKMKKSKNKKIIPKKKISIASRFKLNKEKEAKRTEEPSQNSEEGNPHSDSEDLTLVIEGLIHKYSQINDEEDDEDEDEDEDEIGEEYDEELDEDEEPEEPEEDLAAQQIKQELQKQKTLGSHKLYVRQASQIQENQKVEQHHETGTQRAGVITNQEGSELRKKIGRQRRQGLIFTKSPTLNLDVLSIQNRHLKRNQNLKKQLSLSKDDSELGRLNKHLPLKKIPTKRISEVVSTTNYKKSKNKINQYKVIKELGSGAFATVKLCIDTKNENLYAIKQMNKKSLKKKMTGNNKNAYDCVKEELKVLQRLDHPNIIYLHEIIDDPKKDDIYLVTEYHSKGSLGYLVQQRNSKHQEHNAKCAKEGRFQDMKTMGLKEGEVRAYFQDMLKALFYCHNIIKVIHRDIKPDNIMINHNNEAVLIDFGVSAIVEGQQDDELKNNMGSYMFFAPEMFNINKEGVKVRGERTDIWALGVTLYYLLCGRYPFESAKTPLDLKELILKHPINLQPIKQPQARLLLQHILEKDPDQRATLNQIIQHQWVTNKGKELIELGEVQAGGNFFGNIWRQRKIQNPMFGTSLIKLESSAKNDLVPVKKSGSEKESSKSSKGSKGSTSSFNTDSSMAQHQDQDQD